MKSVKQVMYFVKDLSIKISLFDYLFPKIGKKNQFYMKINSGFLMNSIALKMKKGSNSKLLKQKSLPWRA